MNVSVMSNIFGSSVKGIEKHSNVRRNFESVYKTLDNKRVKTGFHNCQKSLRFRVGLHETNNFLKSQQLSKIGVSVMSNIFAPSVKGIDKTLKCRKEFCICTQKDRISYLDSAKNR